MRLSFNEEKENDLYLVVSPLAHGVLRFDDRQAIHRIVYVIRYDIHSREAPKEYRSHKSLYNRFIRWSRLDVFDRIFAVLAGEGLKSNGVMT